MDLTEFKLEELRQMASEMDIECNGKTRRELSREINEAFRLVEDHCENLQRKYKRGKLLGTGKQGTTYEVSHKGKKYAMKTFADSKSSTTLATEIRLQNLAADRGIAPHILESDTVEKIIVMDKMDGHLMDYIRQGKKLTSKHEKRLLEIFRGLDDVGVFHGDANIANYMLKGDKIYLVDFGLGKKITPGLIGKLGTRTPNVDIALLGFLLKLREMNYPLQTLKYLRQRVPESTLARFGL